MVWCGVNLFLYKVNSQNKLTLVKRIMEESEKKKRKTKPQDYIDEAKRYTENAINIFKEKDRRRMTCP